MASDNSSIFGQTVSKFLIYKALVSVSKFLARLRLFKLVQFDNSYDISRK